MSEARIDQLIRVESRLTRSFICAAAVILASILWVLFIAGTKPSGPIALVFTVLQIGCYVWYAKSAGAAATALRETGWKYVVWILAAPFLALLPIPVVSTLIGASPLAIKFLLGGRLQTAIRDESVADLHGHG
jgi:hypothetical protein